MLKRMSVVTATQVHEIFNPAALNNRQIHDCFRNSESTRPSRTLRGFLCGGSPGDTRSKNTGGFMATFSRYLVVDHMSWRLLGLSRQMIVDKRAVVACVCQV